MLEADLVLEPGLGPLGREQLCNNRQLCTQAFKLTVHRFVSPPSVEHLLLDCVHEGVGKRRNEDISTLDADLPSSVAVMTGHPRLRSLCRVRS